MRPNADPTIGKASCYSSVVSRWQVFPWQQVILSISDEDIALAMIDAGMSLTTDRPADKCACGAGD
jgi:hypothetical protein